jgi:hypothetical protein
MKISYLMRNLSKISKFNYSVRHIDIIETRNKQFLQKVMQTNDYSQEEFSNFLRVVNNSKADKDTQERFLNLLPRHLEQLNDLDTRKAISIVLKYNIGHDELLPSLKKRFLEVRKEKGFKLDKGYVTIGTNFKSYPVSIRFWVGFARLRERFYINIRKILKFDLK